MFGLKILVQTPTFWRGSLVPPHNFCHPEQISTGTPNCFELTKTSLVTEWVPQRVACSLHNLQLPYKSDRWDFSSTSFGETFDNCLWREIPQTGKKGKRGQRAKTLFTFTLNFPGHLQRAVFAILVMFLMVFECIWGWGVGHLHKGWFIWFMDCDGSAATDGFLMFMSEYLVCVYMHPPVLMPWCQWRWFLITGCGRAEGGRTVHREKQIDPGKAHFGD